MEHTTEQQERDVLYAQLQNEAASLDTIHEMLGSGKWNMDFDQRLLERRIPADVGLSRRGRFSRRVGILV